MNCATHIDISSSLYWNDHFKMDLSQTYVTACALCNVCVCPCVSFEMTHMALPNILSFCFTTSCYVQHTINIFTHSLIAHHSNNFSYKGKYWFSHDRRLSDYHSQSHGIQLLWHIFHSTHSFSERPNRSSLQQCNINKKKLSSLISTTTANSGCSINKTDKHTHIEDISAIERDGIWWLSNNCIIGQLNCITSSMCMYLSADGFMCERSICCVWSIYRKAIVVYIVHLVHVAILLSILKNKTLIKILPRRKHSVTDASSSKSILCFRHIRVVGISKHEMIFSREKLNKINEKQWEIQTSNNKWFWSSCFPCFSTFGTIMPCENLF